MGRNESKVKKTPRIGKVQPDAQNFIITNYLSLKVLMVKNKQTTTLKLLKKLKRKYIQIYRKSY